ncbi:hypothetical protein ACIRU3_42410 [Streptomyces sp. NPDC101151]|uniref:hypothetical protein n=1 Tax=Streptomyces sp. NPDC101151 TaxID=3366115 RepID=UPI00381826E0
MVHSQLSGPEETPARLRTAGLRAEVINRARLPFGRVLRHRPAWLRERKLVTDRMTEELVVIHAEHA